MGPGGIQTAADDQGGSGLPLLTSWTQDRTCHLPSVPSFSSNCLWAQEAPQPGLRAGQVWTPQDRAGR